MNFDVFLGFQKNENKCGDDEIVDIFGGHHKTGLFLGVIYIHFRAFSLSQGTESEYFWGVAKFQIFFGYA